MTTNRKKVLVLGSIHRAGIDMLEARADIAVEVVEQEDASIPERVGDAAGIIVRTCPIDGPLIARAPALVVVARHGVGYDNVDVEALSARGIPLMLVGEANALAVAEHTLYLMLALAKQGPRYDRALRAGNWRLRESRAASELAGKRLLIVGFGRIGTRVARFARAFDMTVTAFDPVIDPALIAAAEVTAAPALRPALGEADYVTVHVPLSAATRHLIGAAELAAMKRSAVLINTARGGLVDETALVEALRAGAIRGAGLDVFDREPPADDNPLLGLDNVVLSPHSAGLTAECMARMSRVCAENVLGALDGAPHPPHVVNAEVLGGR